MPDTPQRANAAQIAQRNLKNLKQQRRRPLGSQSPQPQQQSFAPPSQQGGLLFGGIQGPSDFSFSVGGPSMSFPGFGSKPEEIDTDDDNGRAGKDEEDKRRNPGFRGNGEARPDDDHVPQFAPMPQELQGFTQKSQQNSNSNSSAFGASQQKGAQPAPGRSVNGLIPFSLGSSAPNRSTTSTSNSFGSPQQSGAQSFGGSQQKGAQPASTGNSGAPANGLSPFSFGSPAPSRPTTSTSNVFGSATQPAQPPSSPFSFGSSAPPTAQQQAPSSGFNFGQPAAQKNAASNPFAFGQSTTSPKPTGDQPMEISPPVNKPSQPAQPSSILFGSSAPSTNNIFGNKSQGPAPPANNFFGGNSQNTASAPQTQSLFAGASPASSQPPKNLFGSLQSPSPTPATSNFFGTTSQNTPTTGSSIFAGQNQKPAASSGGLFDRISKDSDGNPIRQIPVEEKKSATPSLFDRISKDSNGNPIRQIPTEEKENTQPTINGSFDSPSQQPPPTDSLFGNQAQQQPAVPTSSLFGGIGQRQQSTPTNNLFSGLNQQQQSAPPNSLFSGMNQQQQSAPTNSLFGHLNQPLNGNGNNDLFLPPNNAKPERPSLSSASSKSQTAASPTSTSNGNKDTSSMKPVGPPTSATQPPPSGMFPSLPSGQSQTASNESLSKAAPSNSSTTTSPSGSTSNNLAKSIESKDVESNNPPRSMNVPPADLPDEVIRPLMPSNFTEVQAKEFCAKYRMRALNKAMQKAFQTIPLGMDPAPVMSYYYAQRNKIILGCEQWFQPSKRKAIDEDQESNDRSKRARQEPTSSTNGQTNSPFKSQQFSAPQPSIQASPTKSQPQVNGSTTPRTAPPSFSNPPPSTSPSKGKRKAEYQLTDQDPEGKGEEERRMKMPKLNGSVGSETSNIFKNILDSPAKSSPEKRVSGRLETLEKKSNNEAQRPNPFASIAVPGSPSKAASNGTSANMFAQKAATSPSKPVLDSSTTKSGNTFGQKPAASTSSLSSTTQPIKPPTFGIKPPSFGNSPVNFLAQFGQQAKKDEKDNEEKLMEKAKEEDMDSDDDEAEWEAKYKEKRRAELKAIEDLAKSKRASFVAGKGFTFGEAPKAPITAVSESDEPPTNPSPAKSIFSQSSSAVPTASKSLFGQTPVQSASTSVFGSTNGSRSSTPGGSVLDSHTPGKPVVFDGIFGHLSNAGSPAGSGKDNESDDESEENAESDSENKDPTYKPAEPGSEDGSGPTTPVEKTGAGIASAKKATSTPFSFGNATQPLTSGKPLFGQPAPTSNSLFGTATPSSGSGTSSPAPSLFDRISRDSNGNPIRQVPTEEKENTQPNTTNIFGGSNTLFGKSLSATSGTPAAIQSPDKTWKPDSPIKFGAATANGATAPSVSVTNATPTKSNPFSGLFGSSTTQNSAPPVTGGLFGSSTLAKPAVSGGVGFGFGGPSNTASSLFPSSGASASTSRATSPGQTTDGDSAVEGGNDPDAEHHEQIDLTKGGPGEENEDLVHEVRAKALKFVPGEGDGGIPWVTKGVGPLRVLKHKETEAARVLLRADPSGTIILNKGILAGLEFVANGKTVKFMAVAESGSGFETWMLQVKTPELAKALAEALEANKSSS